MIELPAAEIDRPGLLSALWTKGAALTSEAAALIEDLTRQVEAAERRAAALESDRDYWREQHDMVMADWKSDLQALASGRSDAEAEAPSPDVFRAALVSLLRFFDAKSGAVFSRNGRELISDAFSEAAKLFRRAPALDSRRAEI